MGSNSPHKTRRLVLVGDSAFAEIAHEYFEVDSNYTVVAYSVERDYLRAEQRNGLPVVPFEDLHNIYDPADHDIYVATVYTQLNRLRTRLAATARARGYRLASYVSSRAFVWRNVQLGEHVFIFENNTVQPFVRIGNNVVLWSGNHIGHHSTIRDNCFISSHVVISGFCDVGDYSFLGVNATVANNVTIGRNNWIGPNAAIMKNTRPGAFYRTVQPEPHKLTAPEFFKIDEE